MCAATSSVFPRATIYWSSIHRSNAEPRDVWLSLSTCLRWKNVQQPDEPAPNSFSEFRGHYCLKLERLPDGSTWDDQVADKVKPVPPNAAKVDNGYPFSITGKISGPGIHNFSHFVQLVLVASSITERNSWIGAMRVLISPWSVLHNRLVDYAAVVARSNLSEEALDALLACADNHTQTDTANSSNNHVTVMQAIKNAMPFIDNLNVLSGFIDLVAIIVKNTAPKVKNFAEEMADIAKCVTVVSSSLHVVVLCATLIDMGIEVKRGNEYWPRIKAEIEELQCSVLKSTIYVLHPNGSVEPIVMKQAFEVQRKLFNVLCDVEKEMMRKTHVIRYLKAHELRRIEGAISDLRDAVVQVVSSGSVARMKLRQDIIDRAVSDLKRDVAKMEHTNTDRADEFKTYFDSPQLQCTLVFDFELRDDTGARSTSEGQLLDAVLRLAGADGSYGASALGTSGMGGVGKTTALKRICHDERVREKYIDGVHFLEFGQHADDGTVMSELERLVHHSGGLELAKEMRELRKNGKLSEVVNRVAEWMKGRTVLLVCDDLWATDGRDFGYAYELRRVLRSAPLSRMLVSTRNRSIASEIDTKPVNFDVVPPYGRKARNILYNAAFGADFPDVLQDLYLEAEIRGILDVCGGLPLALSIAGSGMRSEYSYCRDKAYAIREFSKTLQQTGVSRLCRTSKLEYHTDGLNYVVEASLDACDAWGRQNGHNYDMRRFFRSLCVFEKHQSVPERVLQLYWSLNQNKVAEVVKKLADLNLVKRELFLDSKNNAGLFYVRIHDLVLDLCQQLASDEINSYHLEMIEAYASSLPQTFYNEVREKNYSAWWLLEDEGYAYENISRHLTCAGQNMKLESLLCDCRWTVRRMEIGGWAALNRDFQNLFNYSNYPEHAHYIAMYDLHQLLQHSWHAVWRHRSLFPFNVFGRLYEHERSAKCISSYLQSLRRHYPGRWLCPLTKCIGSVDAREISSWNMPSSVHSVCVSWSNHRIYFAIANKIYVWCIESLEQIYIMKGHTDDVVSVAVSNDDKLIVSGSKDKTVRRWDGSTGLQKGDAMVGHTGWVRSVAISDDGKLIVSGSDDHTVRRWNANTGLPEGEAMRGHTDLVRSVAISGDGQLIVSGSWDRSVRLWYASNGLQKGDAMEGHTDWVSSVAISRNGLLVVSGSRDKTVRRWNVKTGRPEGDAMEGHTDLVRSVAISDDGQLIVSGSWDKSVRLWDANTGLQKGDAMEGHTDWVSSVAISSNGQHIVSGSDDCTVRRWDANIEQPEGKATDGHTSMVNSVAISADGNLIASGSSDNTVRRWDAKTGYPLGDAMEGHTGMVNSVMISGDGQVIVSGSWDNTLRRWNAKTGEPLGDAMKGHTDRVNSVAISNDGRLIVSGSDDRTVRRWDTSTGIAKENTMKGHKDWVNSVAISGDGQLIVSGSSDKRVRRWDSKTGNPLGDAMEGHTSWVHSVAVSDDGLLILSRSLDKTARVWDAKTGEMIGDASNRAMSFAFHSRCLKRDISLTGNDIDVLPINAWCHAVSTDGKKAVLGMRNGCVVVCEVLSTT